ncbi:hypothetical protein PL11201_530137 [Planktothrix sp. PCC 11201]|uniref:HesA/MoeB/ThiF family protein n=1 Tax=Planktothrix sp. PCC 11201 TaxID=1729650 RepID=UPI0009149F3F|nr:ThiF family adenylyltransferase [Planktothrix sp. PCC 11201]SKB13807.1 hypothetical protein PL11201_530137 [Planktothrix sp. PCC 11201]
MLNHFLKPQKIFLHIPPAIWSQFQQALLESRQNNEEVIGFLFCKRHEVSSHQIRYEPKVWIVPTADCYEYQSVTGLVLKQQFHLHLLQTYIHQEKLDIVHIHTHPGQEIPFFSSIDDHHESEYARFLTTNFKTKPRLISGVFDQSFQNFKFRIWDKQGRSSSPVDFSSSWFENSITLFDKTKPMFTRQQVFGETFQKQLNQLTVTLIGCGGIGAIFAEILSRLGVKNWILIDPDRLEDVNLNRMPGATWEMVDEQMLKVEYVKHLIKKVYRNDGQVKAIPSVIENQLIQPEIATSDLIVVATDNHYSRQIAQELAIKFRRPLVCLGTHIDMKPNGMPRMYCRMTVPPLGGSWCLMCGNMINLQQAALESAAPEIGHLAQQRGYIAGVNDPAVFWLNSLCASTGVGVIQGIVGGFLKIDSGLDWIYEFPECKWHKTDTSYLVNSDCYFCGSKD